MTDSTTQTNSAQYDVIIVGCGPVGATLANYLRKFGHKTAIFDRDKDIFYAPRAMNFDDEAQRAFQNIEILDRIRNEGHSYEWDGWFRDNEGRLLMEFNRDRLGDDLMMGACNHYTMTIMDQPNVERILRDDFQLAPTVDSFLGYEVLSVTDEGSQATLSAQNLETDEEITVEAKYIVGCDGGRSLVRRAMAVDRIDLGYSEEYLVVDAIVDDKNYFDTEIPHGARFRYDSRHGGVVVKGLHGHVRFDVRRHPEVMQATNETDADYAKAAQELIQREGFDPDKFRVIRHAPYTFYAGMPDQWRKNRLMVAGDAAHQTPPWAGQGLNMGIRDAANLSFKLNLVLTGKASDTLLDSYDSERRPASMATIKGAVMQGKLIESTNPIKVAVRNFMLFLTRKSRFMNRFLWNSNVNKPPFKEGLVGKTHKLSGSLMIQPFVKNNQGVKQLMDDVIGLNFALITLKAPDESSVKRFREELNGQVLTLGDDLIDIDGKLSTFFKKNRVSAILLRPDRYVFDAGNDSKALCNALLESLS